MPLPAGSRVGPYEIRAAVGAGGMGEVYKARDTKLHHDVAIKVLPDSFADDVQRLARFQREAELLASLNPSQYRGDLRSRRSGAGGSDRGLGADYGCAERAG